MKDQTDKSTVDLFQASRRRGRPVTGQAMTNAERQRLYRQNLKSRNVTENTSTVITIIDGVQLDPLALKIEVSRWRDLYYKRDADAQNDIRECCDGFERKLAAQKAASTKYRNECLALRDKVLFLERQLAQRNEKE